MSGTARNLAVIVLWIIDGLCIAVPVVTAFTLLLGAAVSAPAVRHAGYTLVMVEIETARFLCLAGLVAFGVGWRLRAVGPAAYAAYGLLLNAGALWLALTPVFAA